MCSSRSNIYGCQSWSLTEVAKEKLAVEQRSKERKMLNIKWTDKIQNSKIRERSKIKDVIQVSKTLKWNWAGIQSYHDDRWAKHLENWEPDDV